MTAVEKERICQQELDEIQRLIGVDTSGFPADVEAALHFLHAHLFEESLNASSVQQQDGLRSHNLPARFKLHLGLGLRDYIEDRRMMAAMRLLWHREIEIYFVAAAVGYAHHETFTRAFKRRIGCTPSDFRTHFATVTPTDPPPIDPLPTDPPPIEAPLPIPQPSEAPMFITDVVGIRAAEETYELRVSGTAAGLTEVYVNATAGGESRSQVADVEPSGKWVALFGGGVFACGRPLEVEVGTEGRAHARWEGLLDCAEMAPRRSRAREESADEEAHATAARTQDGGAYGGDAAMTVTVAAGRGPAPPPVRGAGGGDDGGGSYYESPRGRKPSPRSPEGDEEATPRRAVSEDEVRDLREELEALRSEIGALTQNANTASADQRNERRDDTEDAKASHSRDTSDRASGPAASTPDPGDSDGVQEQIKALRSELRERWGTSESDDEAERTDDDGEANVAEQETSDEDEHAWQRAIHDLSDQIASLHNRAETEENAPADENEEPPWQRQIRDLQDQIAALRRNADAGDTDDERDTGERDTGDLEAEEAHSEATRLNEACDDETVSPAENRADLYDAVRALRERIVELEKRDSEPSRRPPTQSEARPDPGRRARHRIVATHGTTPSVGRGRTIGVSAHSPGSRKQSGGPPRPANRVGDLERTRAAPRSPHGRTRPWSGSSRSR